MGNENLDSTSLQDLTEIFRQAGAKDPELWASSQIEGGMNQLGRFSFLKSITSEWLKEDDTAWVDNQIEFDYTEPGDAGSQLPRALKEMLDKGVERESIIDLVREIQFLTLYHVCSIIDKSIEADTPIKSWNLYELDENGNPLKVIHSLYEGILEFDPSGNEMRPRRVDNSR